ncbi:MAG: hypothetical protein AAFR38_09445 [Planctomycetota bacterium]
MEYGRLPWQAEYRTYSVQRKSREPLVRFIVDGLQAASCRVIFASDPGTAPFRVTFETPQGERLGIVAYAFLANRRVIKNRPSDERRFQIKYGSDTRGYHDLWQDPLGLYTTLLIGIDPEDGIFVSADPIQNSPTRFFKSVEFKDDHAQAIQAEGWFAWERHVHYSSRCPEDSDRYEVLVGCRQDEILRLIKFEREALGEDPGHRQWLADQPRDIYGGSIDRPPVPDEIMNSSRVHILAREFELDESQVFDLIASTPRLKMAVRGWVAEEHLRRHLASVPGVSDCERLIGDKQSDVSLRYRGSRPIIVECKNALRKTDAQGRPRVDLQRARASLSDPCSRYYSPEEFDLVAACLHAVTDRWEFRFHTSATLAPHTRCAGKLDNKVRVGEEWIADVESRLAQIADVA